MDKRDSFVNATEKTESVGKIAGFKRGTETVALNLSALLKEHGANISADAFENDR